MNRYRVFLPALALAGLLAACAPGAAEPTQMPTDAASVSMAPSPTAGESADPSSTPHDMGGMDGSGETATVEISNFTFSPAELTISAGTEVTFTNLDSAPHTVTAGTDSEPMPDSFDSGLLQQGKSFTFVFDEPGTYVYFCDRHPPMEGSITVEG